MTREFLEYYNDELAFIREMGHEFARQHPKIAGRLGMQGIDVADPYVERLLEGFSFLTARIQMKMDAQYPQLTANLLDILHPAYTAPLPSMTVVQCTPSVNQGNMAQGACLPRHTVMRAGLPKGEQTSPEFLTTQDVQLSPLQLRSLQWGGLAPQLKTQALSLGRKYAIQPNQLQRVLSLEFSLEGGVALKDLRLDQLMMYLHGQGQHMYALLEYLLTKTAGILVHDHVQPLRWANFLPASALCHEGFRPEQAMLPVEARQFQGHRLLQEFFAFPERFLFLSVQGLQAALQLPDALRTLTDGREPEQTPRAFQLSFLLTEAAPELENIIQARHFALHCTPAINLMRKRADRVAIQNNQHQYHIVVDRTRPLDFEIYAIEKVIGYTGHGARQELEFRPFYQTRASDGENYGTYFTVQRQARLPSEQVQLAGGRSAYLGSEVSVQLVDQQQDSVVPECRHLAATVWCTNRDLPLMLQSSEAASFTLKNISAPVQSIRMLRAPSAPQGPLAQGEYAWRLIKQLEQNYYSLDGNDGVAHLRALLSLHARQHESHANMLQQSIHEVSVQMTHQRLPMPGPMVFGRGVQVRLVLDERALAGWSPFLLGAVLEQYICRHVGINMMSQLSLHSLQRGHVATWPARGGARPAV
ncbi:type VI secretion system baseplate subunit TssF [Alcaligenes endophyticus]|uniref:Type VI secretion system baseplate subunit TssF n=1 Tax=Alcaligenes endophyticus TaxID=1929088 RepID=A0ABT8EKQ0_9BURK|nr:type VI secretion system baseplate subunit TssF [Alcaligenes endophyticus]MCX5590774.1 type VI secretion system baseplate subunit TssF [Alcaligenes endophyticus]MDN4121863.1 type VI secretion system baseplate subunit TssF [Alcaligenes endophyticus]